MKLREMAGRYKNRAECAKIMGITVANLNEQIYRDRDIEELVSGGWLLVNTRDKVFNFD